MREKLQTVVIETPEHYELKFGLAGIGTRFVAYLIDKAVQVLLLAGLALFVLTVFYVLSRVFPQANVPKELAGLLGRWVLALAVLVYGAVTGGYFILFEYLWNGSTPGKRAQQIRVIRKDGRPITFMDAAVRNILRFVDILAEIYPIGLVVMFPDSKNRRLGDLTAGTLVVVDESARLPPVVERSDENCEDPAEVRQAVSSMKPHDYRIVAQFLARRTALEPDHRERLAREICMRLMAKAHAVPRAGSDPELLLERISVLYRERTRVL